MMDGKTYKKVVGSCGNLGINVPDMDSQYVKDKKFKRNVLSHSVICWMLCLQRLPRRDRLKAWNVAQDDKCMFGCEAESMEHLFYRCSYTRDVLRKILMYNYKFHQSRSWKVELADIVEQNGGK
ncbi:hypothetical protein Leryth_023927, partial [Lithospermum erythrorhizon]